MLRFWDIRRTPPLYQGFQGVKVPTGSSQVPRTGRQKIFGQKALDGKLWNRRRLATLPNGRESRAPSALRHRGTTPCLIA